MDRLRLDWLSTPCRKINVLVACSRVGSRCGVYLVGREEDSPCAVLQLPVPIYSLLMSQRQVRKKDYVESNRQNYESDSLCVGVVWQVWIVWQPS